MDSDNTKKVDKMLEQQGISPDEMTPSDKQQLAEEIDE
jgi:hypothetical protein